MTEFAMTFPGERDEDQLTTTAQDTSSMVAVDFQKLNSSNVVDESGLTAAEVATTPVAALKPKRMFQKFLAEFLGTFVLCGFGCGSVAQFELTKMVNEGKKLYDVMDERGTFLSVTICWAIGVTFGCFVAGSVSEAHLNPAVTLALASLRRFPLADIPLYWAAQLSGAFCAAVLVYGVYIDAINHFDGGHRQVYSTQETVSIFATYPEQFLTVGGGLLDQIVGTMMLVLCIFAVNDEQNISVPAFMKPIIIGGIVVAVGSGFGLNTG
jgi:MIP family channel proteins